MLVRHETKIKSILVFTYLYDEFYDDEIPEDVYKELTDDGIRSIFINCSILCKRYFKLIIIFLLPLICGKILFISTNIL